MSRFDLTLLAGTLFLAVSVEVHARCPETVISKLNSPESAMRTAALADLLHQVGPDFSGDIAVDALRDLLQQPPTADDSEARLTVQLSQRIAAYGGDTGAILLGPLHERLSSAAGKQRIYIILAIAEYGSKAASVAEHSFANAAVLDPSDPFVSTVSAYAWHRIDDSARKPVTLLTQWCRSDDDTLRLNALVNLGRCGRGAIRAENVVRMLLVDNSAAIRTAAAQSLFQITGDAQHATDVLCVAFAMPPEIFRTEPAHHSEWLPDHKAITLGILGEMTASGDDVVHVFRRALASDDEVLRLVAVRNVCRIDHTAASELKDTILTLTRSDESHTIRSEASSLSCF